MFIESMKLSKKCIIHRNLTPSYNSFSIIYDSELHTKLKLSTNIRCLVFNSQTIHFLGSNVRTRTLCIYLLTNNIINSAIIIIALN